MSDLITARHTVTGIIDDYPANIISHPVLGQYLEPVEGDAETEPEVAEVSEPDDEDEEDKVVRDKKIFRRSGGSTDKEPSGVNEDKDGA